MRDIESAAPRNRRLYDQGQLARAEIRKILLDQSQASPLITAKQIQRRLRCAPLPSLRTIQWHVNAIRQEISGKHCACRNLFGSTHEAI
jgi:hypothetical protein